MSQVTAVKEEEFTGRFDWAVWKKLFGAVGRYRRRLIALCVTAVVLAGVDSMFPLLTRAVIGEAASDGPAENLWVYAAAYFGLVCAFAVLCKVFITLAGGISAGVAHDVRRRAFAHLQQLSFGFYDRRPAGWLIARVTSDCERLARTLAWGSLDVIWGTCMTLALCTIMLVVDWKLALIVMGAVPVMVWVSLTFQKRILSASRQVRKTNSDLTASYSECISGVRTTKTLVREESNAAEFADVTARMRDWSVRSAAVSAAYFPTIMLVASVATGLTLWAGGWRVQIGGTDLQTLVMFLYCARLIHYPIEEMARVFAELPNTQAAAERVFGLIDTVPEVRDTEEVVARSAERQAGAEVDGLAEDGMPDEIREIEFRDVCFAYGAGKPVLEAFSLTVRAGQTIALVGPTGGGKTTVVSLACRFYEPTAGQILIDGVDYRRRSLHWLQSNLGIVLQTPHLFSGTIAENIRYARPGATDEEMVAAARLVRADEFIERLDGGYDTQVGEGGARLATGQRQLISFARAVLADPKIFVMDEATSSIDTETERRIQAGLAAVLEGRISFIIAHRLSTIRSAAAILVIDGGRIVEAGTHRELMARRGRYHRLYTNQFAEQRTAELLARKSREER